MTETKDDFMVGKSREKFNEIGFFSTTYHLLLPMYNFNQNNFILQETLRSAFFLRVRLCKQKEKVSLCLCLHCCIESKAVSYRMIGSNLEISLLLQRIGN